MAAEVVAGSSIPAPAEALSQEKVGVGMAEIQAESPLGSLGRTSVGSYPREAVKRYVNLGKRAALTWPSRVRVRLDLTHP